MTDISTLLTRWQKAGVLDAEHAERIRAFEHEQERPTELRWQGLVALILGALLLACGLALFVSAHWDDVGPGGRYAIVMAIVAVFHMGGAWTRERYRGVSTALHAVGTAATGQAIALAGQIFNIQEHWPAAILLWASAAVAGWLLLRDQAQQTMALLLIPAWVFSEFSFYANGHIGMEPYLGRFLLVWSMLYLTVFLGSKEKVTRGILFAASAVASITGTAMMLDGWSSYNASQTFLPLHLQVWGWIVIAAIPLAAALFRRLQALVPVAVGVAYTVVLPWCLWVKVEHYDHGNFHNTWNRTEPRLLAHGLVASMAIFLIWWGVRQASKALVNLGMVWFAISVGWFYFSDLFDKMGRSLGLIGLGILFLAGGWALETMRRKLVGMAGGGSSSQPVEEVL